MTRGAGLAVPVQTTLFAQRWRERREWRVPPRGVIDPARYQVELIEQTHAKAFVVRHHYSGSFPAARISIGLFEQGRGRTQLVGVAVFGVPINQRVIPHHLDLAPESGVELSRLVLLDRVAGNAESWFVARAFRWVQQEKPGIAGVVSYCDPVPRRTLDGEIVLPGHVGTVYQALNAVYRGRSAARTLWLGSAGQVISERAISKIRGEEQGAEYAAAQLRAAGAPPRRLGESAAAWVARTRASGCLRSVRHPGNHVYVFGLDRGIKRRLRVVGGAAYPKLQANESGRQVQR